MHSATQATLSQVSVDHTPRCGSSLPCLFVRPSLKSVSCAEIVNTGEFLTAELRPRNMVLASSSQHSMGLLSLSAISTQNTVVEPRKSTRDQVASIGNFGG